MDNFSNFKQLVIQNFTNKDLQQQILSKKELFKKYLDFIIKWKQHINITGFDEKKFIYNGIIEPLLILNKFTSFSDSITDIGSGAGIPSISLSIFHTDIKVFAVEINKKRLSFLNYLKFNLALQNLTVSDSPPEYSKFVTSRAFMSFEKFIIFLKERGINYDYILFYFKDKVAYSDELKEVTSLSYNSYYQVIFEKSHQIRK